MTTQDRASLLRYAQGQLEKKGRESGAGGRRHLRAEPSRVTLWFLLL